MLSSVEEAGRGAGPVLPGRRWLRVHASRLLRSAAGTSSGAPGRRPLSRSPRPSGSALFAGRRREVQAVVRGQTTCHISLPSLATTQGCGKRKKVVVNSSAASFLKKFWFNSTSCFSQCVSTFVFSLLNP